MEKSVITAFISGLLFFSLIIISCTSEKSIDFEEAEIYITEKLNHFLDYAATSAEVHDKFWSDELIYTSSAGSRFGKQTIMEGFDTSDDEDSETPTVRYYAEDTSITFYQKTARLTFTLVAEDMVDGEIETTRFYNSGMLVPESDSWEVVLWQATRKVD